jgi:squalene synthase HpnC
MAVDHYENFPVASLLMPRDLRPAVMNIYRFARHADDLADEGELTSTQRLDALTACSEALHHLRFSGPLSSHDALAPVFNPLCETIVRHDLPFEPFEALLSAFVQDVSQHHYDDDADLARYCERSANPVGHLMLLLYQASTPHNRQLSDAICTGLQLVNFWQDVALDWDKGRVYIPQSRLARHNLDSKRLLDQIDTPAWRALMLELTDDARNLLLSGLPLAAQLKGRIGFELRLIVHGGLRILDKLKHHNFDVVAHRPKMGPIDWLSLPFRALWPRQAPPAPKPYA